MGKENDIEDIEETEDDELGRVQFCVASCETLRRYVKGADEDEEVGDVDTGDLGDDGWPTAEQAIEAADEWVFEEPFEIRPARRGMPIGEVSNRWAWVYAEVLTEYGWERCDEHGRAWDGGDVPDPLHDVSGTTDMLDRAWGAAVWDMNRYLDHEADEVGDVLYHLGWRGEGWYVFDAFDPAGSTLSRMPACWVEGVDAFSKRLRAAFGRELLLEPRVRYLGASRFPDKPVDVEEGSVDFDYVRWREVREEIAGLLPGEVDDYFDNLEG